MSDSPAELQRQAYFLLGPWVIGCCLDIFLEGVVICQIVNYFGWYKEDSLYLKAYVALLALFSVLKSVQAFAIIWIQNIVFMNNVPGAVLLNYTFWLQAGNPLIVATFNVYVQAYFCYRLYVVSKKWFVVVPVATLFAFAYFSMILATYYITQGVGASKQIADWFAAHLSSVFAADVSMSLTTAYFLLKTKKNVLPQTVGLISALVRLTLQTAAPVALCAMFNLIFSQVYTGSQSLASTAFNMMLPKLYALSTMWTLNARRTIQASRSTRGVSSSNEISGGRTRRTRREDVELGNFGGIQVHTVQETVQHIDLQQVRDMFSGDTKSGGVTSSTPGTENEMEYKG
ncbi:unnamed protein product [Mycena citricolor]|uniref:DUF6534 domain-containing protein n=1 Tax=Mycena citricolor TaxID=2018698 RepID=A0AAD2JV44_9AGAR|nr:unnamed protein product [Mycena citricolor]CAK5278133.1 unnamed protein product [Mycena citricolor]